MGRTPAVIWCDNCEEWQPCRSVNSAADGVFAEDFGQTDYANGLHAFRRARSCERCGEIFYTLELNEATLIQQEKILDTIKKAVAKLR